jgi:hypothetical protein
LLATGRNKRRVLDWNQNCCRRRLEQETGVSFLPSHLRLLLLESKWAEAEAYVSGPIDLAGCSWMASRIIGRIRVFDVMSRFAAGEASTISDDLFRRADAHLLGHPDLHGASRVLHSMRSDPYQCVSQSLTHHQISTVAKTRTKIPIGSLF